ncbi:type IV secretory system conjugative DNA transfer family protein [Kibdelosporangium aridum]|uniref:type IV secretory system conjugative DNA transfer family protein n=1 Tax=Kibdelosporangium aridum TaxID=2030 RepID=UPI0021AD6F7C|nr:type IV secretory system conjugative DNA transfer family protein [Kibdelosporangium aridum]
MELLGLTPPRQPDSDERQGWKHKLTEPIFGIRGRIGAVTDDRRRAAELLRPVVSALALAGGPRGRVYATPQSSQVATRLSKVMGRLRSWSGIVNAAELAALSGWCRAGQDVPGGAGPFPPPPAQLLHPADSRSLSAGSRPLGRSTHPATVDLNVWLPRSSYGVHTHVIGPPGRGKSTLLCHWIAAEATGRGSVIVIEPKGDLVRDVLARLPYAAHKRTVVIDPGADGLPVVGFNPLVGSHIDAERRVDSILSLLRNLFGTAIGPRSADVLWHALLMAARLEDGALTDVPPLLTNPAFRRWAASRTSEPLTLGPWVSWFDGLSDDLRAQVIAPVLNKIRVWTARPAIRRLLGQPQPVFDLSQVFQQPTVLLVNLNAGVIGPETARLIGALLLQQIWQLAQGQTALPTAQRLPVSVIVDEFQYFTSGLDFADALARGRGANVSYTLCHQHLAQLSPHLQATVLANIGARVVFRPATGDSRLLAQVLGAPIKPDDLDQLGAYHAAARVLVDGAPSQPFEFAAPPLPDALQEPGTLHQASAQRFGAEAAAIDAALLARWQDQAPPDAPIGLRRRPS